MRSGPFVAVAISETDVRPRLRRGGRRASDSRLSLPRIVGPLMIVTTVCSFAAFYDVCRLGLQTGYLIDHGPFDICPSTLNGESRYETDQRDTLM